MVVRTSTDPLAIVGPIRQAVPSLDGDQPVSFVKTMTDYVSHQSRDRVSIPP